jgi:hypothetical protein
LEGKPIEGDVQRCVMVVVARDGVEPSTLKIGTRDISYRREFKTLVKGFGSPSFSTVPDFA